ncbi:DNA polymerase III subunit delta [Candidatus Enterovibrio escicola]|uniref:DNA polymerase III subunit delta n=1 Tax=Candidatus Enterovibrio escicola TaxID=1927127 RepID=A0A2A5SZR1_9GAMM|nr:DNA polymerase III subunit delta [Candidatus Enterovibrio escacola]PCS21403.1 DNA polymerase III delta subunit [Candidatus Enterovibrio escacola]
MRVYPEQLRRHLAQGLCQTYLLFGNELLLKQESLQSILETSAQQGFIEKHRFTIDNQLHWQDVYEICQALSLFSVRQVLIIILPETSLNITQGNALKALKPYLHQDILLVLDGPRLNKKQELKQWFTLFHKNGLYVPCNTPNAQQMPNFIKARCRDLNLKPDHESVLILAQWYEGNLQGLSQSLMKFQFLYPDGTLTLIRLQESLSRHNHYTLFQLTDALIEGKVNRAVRIVRQLQAEAVEITLLLRIIQKEIVQLFKMQELWVSGMPLDKIFDHFRVWKTRQKTLVSTLHRLPSPKLAELLHHLYNIEIMVKTDFDSRPWPELTALCIEMCGYPVLLDPIN